MGDNHYSIASVGQAPCARGSAGSPDKHWCTATVRIRDCDCHGNDGGSDGLGTGKCLTINRPFYVFFLSIACGNPPCVRIAGTAYADFVNTYDAGVGMALSAQMTGYQASDASSVPQWFLYPNGYEGYSFAPPAYDYDNYVCIPVQSDSVVNLSNSELYESITSTYTLSAESSRGPEACADLESLIYAGGYDPPRDCGWWDGKDAECVQHYTSRADGAEYASCGYKDGLCRRQGEWLGCVESPLCAKSRSLDDTQELFPAEFCNDDPIRREEAETCEDYFTSWTESGARHVARCVHNAVGGGSCTQSPSHGPCPLYSPVDFKIAV